jgi:hypothetical protein
MLGWLYTGCDVPDDAFASIDDEPLGAALVAAGTSLEERLVEQPASDAASARTLS